MGGRGHCTVVLLSCLGALWSAQAQPRGSTYSYSGMQDRSGARGANLTLVPRPAQQSHPAAFFLARFARAQNMHTFCMLHSALALTQLAASRYIHPQTAAPYLSSLSPVSGVREGGANITILVC